jgi:GNAT superfamily N-acetyltransferase
VTDEPAVKAAGRKRSRGSAALQIVPATPERWGNLVRLFGRSGAYSNCWCTWWRQAGSGFADGCGNAGAGNRALLQSLVEGGQEPGLIAYRAGEPIGWVSVAPRGEFGRILRSRVLGPAGPPPAADDRTWSVVCFWMPRPERGRGLATALLHAAIAHARSRGATQLEAYPVDAGDKRRPPNALFTGPLSLYRRAGFVEVERRSPSRPIVRLALGR